MDGNFHEPIQLDGEIQEQSLLNGELSALGDVSGEITVPKEVQGTSNYEKLKNKPSIESVTLIGNKTFAELGMTAIDADDLLDILR